MSVVLLLGPLGVSLVHFVREFPLVASALAEEQPQNGTRTREQEDHGGDGDQSARQDPGPVLPARRPPFGTLAKQNNPDPTLAWQSASVHYGLICLLAAVLFVGILGFAFVRRRHDE